MSRSRRPIELTPWAREALSEYDSVAFADRARDLGAQLSVNARGRGGPWIVDVVSRDRRLRHVGGDLPRMIGEVLDRFAAGASDEGIRWTAGADGLSHGHGRPTWARALCGAQSVDERMGHPERARCVACLRALDPVVIA